MSSSNPYRKIISTLIRSTPAGVSLLLGALVLGSGSAGATAVPPTPEASVAERLATIRAAVSEVTTDDVKQNGESSGRDPGIKLAWGNWGGGWGWPNWNNWHNWRNWGNWFRNW